MNRGMGFFMGGAADAMESVNKLGLEKDKLAQTVDLENRKLLQADAHHKDDIGLRGKALSLTEKSAARAEQRQLIQDAEKQIEGTMSIVSETIKGGIQGGNPPEAIMKAVSPLVESAKGLAAKIGRNPATFDAQVNALLMSPTPTQAGTAEGQKAGAKAVAQSAAESAAGLDPNGIKDPVKRVEAENKLRDDFLKQAAPYITIRDAKNRMDTIEKTGAGDIALLFNYMKILDPGSTVREGEFATASSVAGLPGEIEKMRKTVMGEGKLPEGAREQIVSQATKLYQAAENQHKRTREEFKRITKRYGLEPDNVTVDLSPNASNAAGTTASGISFKILGQ